MRYIDADALIEMCKRQIECEWNTIAAPGSWADAFQDFSDLVEQTPTADVAPRSEVAKEIIDDLASEGLLNVEPWGIANLKKKYVEGKDES